MSRWRTIVVADRGRKLHTFDYVPRVQDQEQNVEQPRLAWHHRAVVRRSATLGAPIGDVPRGPSRRQ